MTAAETNGHTRARSEGTATITTAATTATASTAMPAHTSGPTSASSRSTSRSTIGRTTISTRACTTNPASPSIDPDVSATARATPWRSRNRIVSAIFPAALGTVRLMNFTADCSTVVGPRGSGIPTAAVVAAASHTSGSCATTRATIDPRPLRARQLLDDGRDADVGELGEQQVGRHRREARQQDVAERDPPDLGDLGHLPTRLGDDALAQPVDVEGRLAGGVAQRRREGRPLQERHGVLQGGVAEGGAGSGQGLVLSDDERRRDQQLGRVGGEHGIRRHAGGRRPCR